MQQLEKHKGYCSDCSAPKTLHIFSWFDELVRFIFPVLRLTHRFQARFSTVINRILLTIKLVRLDKTGSLETVPFRTRCFVSEARRRGLQVDLVRSFTGQVIQICIRHKGKRIYFESLPTAEHIGHQLPLDCDSKAKTKCLLERGRFPVPKGMSFWHWQIKKAQQHTVDVLGFPVVVKPSSGSFSRHVYTNISTPTDLCRAIKCVRRYSPRFVVEQYIKNSLSIRATVIDQLYVYCAQRSCPQVVGDGESSIEKLITYENDKRSRHACQNSLNNIPIDIAAHSTLASQGYKLDSVPTRGKKIYVHKDPFARLGAGLHEVTEQVHSDNISFFRDISKKFELRLVGIDVMAQDISKSWKEQEFFVLELNSLPCIETHQYPSKGKPQNVANQLVDLFLKYY